MKIFKIEYLPYFLTFLSTSIIFIINIKKEIKKQNNETILMKLREGYNPLYRSLQFIKSGRITDDEVIKDIIVYKSYLLEDSILELIDDVIDYEKKNIPSNVTYDEYKALIVKLIKLVKKESDSLKLLVDKELNKRIYYDKMSILKKIVYKISDMSKNITLIFIGVLITYKIYEKINSVYINNNKIVEVVGVFIAVNIMITVALYLPFKFTEILNVFERVLNKKRKNIGKRFNCYDTVPITATYKCSRCDCLIEHIKYYDFGICKRCNNIQKFKPRLYDWKKI